MFKEARSEASRPLGVFEKLGATEDAEETRKFLGEMDLALVTPMNRLTMVSS